MEVLPPHRALRGRDAKKPRQGLKGRCLAGTVGADEHRDSALEPDLRSSRAEAAEILESDLVDLHRRRQYMVIEIYLFECSSQPRQVACNGWCSQTGATG